MEDAFAHLGAPRAASLDLGELQRLYDERGRILHPDQVGGESSTALALNSAYQVLIHPRTRLKHLLELEAPQQAAVWETVAMDDDMMAAFTRLGAVIRDLEEVLKQREAASSALAKALLSGQQMELQERLEPILEQLEDLRRPLLDRLPQVDALRDAKAPQWVPLVKELVAKLTYLDRWQEQAREALLKLL